MSRTCPHCYGRVIPRRDNSCPSCGKGLDDLTGVDPTRALLTLHEGEALPPLCFNCGTTTQRAVAVRGRRTDERRTESTALLILLFIVSHAAGVLALLLRKRPGTRVELRVPQCTNCAMTHGKPTPEHIAWNTHEMTFEVTKTFAMPFANFAHRRKARNPTQGC